MSLPISAIQRRVAEHFGIRLEDMLSDRQTRSVTRPRQVAMYLARELTPCSLPQIGAAFHRDHTTVYHGIVAIERQIRLHPDLAAAVRQVRAELRQAMGMNRRTC